MARRPRIWFEGAMYHITNRGNRRDALFYDYKDYDSYLDILEEARSYYPFHLHSYCLMTNHIHLQIETIQHHPQYFMQMLNSRYAMYFNKRHHLDGHVFQGRYGAKLVDSIGYLLDVSRYIHLNPVDANMVNAAEHYHWSSYNAYISNTSNPHVTTDKILSYFSDPPKENYRLYVESQAIKQESKSISFNHEK